MLCPIQNRENAEILLDYCDRNLDAERTAVLDRHVKECKDCQEVLASHRAVWSALDVWEAEQISPDFNRRLYEKVARVDGEGWWQKLFRPVLPFSLKPAMPMAAACLILVAAFLFQTPGSVEVRTEWRPEIEELNQVERALEDLEMLRELGNQLRAEAQTGRSM